MTGIYKVAFSVGLIAILAVFAFGVISILPENPLHEVSFFGTLVAIADDGGGGGGDGGGCCGDGGGGGLGGDGGGGGDDNPPPRTFTKPKPVCALDLFPSQIESGGSITLMWTSEHATSASFNQGIGSVATGGSRTVSNITSNKTFTLTVSGPGGTKTCSKTVTVIQQPAPTCTLTAHPTTVSHGGSSTLSWTSSNATSASLNQGIGSVAVNGSHGVSNLTNTRTYTLTVTGPGGTATCSKTIKVEQQPAPTCTLSASPSHVQHGGSSTLSWTTSNATNVSIDQGVGSVAQSGSHGVSNITNTRTYTLTASGPGGSVTCQKTITVEQHQAPSCTLNISPSHVSYNGSATLSWTSSNATAASLDHGIGTVGTSGSYAVSGITGSRTYTLTVSGPGGTATCSRTVTVEVQQMPSCSLSANPTYVQHGNSSTLHWSSNNATSATLNHGIGSVSTNGSYTVYPPQGSTTYVLTVSGPGGTATCSATVVNEHVHQQQPFCTLSASPSSVSYGGSTNLYWSSSNATHAWIDQGVGSVSLSGSYNVYNLTQGKNYTLTVTGPGGTRTCNVYVSVQQNDQLPYCTINVSPNYLQHGGSATLTWSSYGSHVSSAWIDNGVGSVSANGSRSVTAHQTTTYRMTVYDSQGRSNTCQTTLNATPYYPPTQVSLSYIPYTGTDDGAFGFLALSIACFSWAAAGYILYTRRHWLASLVRA